MTNQHNLPDKDDAPWLNHAGLSQKEIEDLRKQKFEISQYAKQKFKELMNPQTYDDDIFDVARKRERCDGPTENIVMTINQNCLGF